MIFDQRELRNALGQFATGIAVVTTVDGKGRQIGVTVNSFASVSLDPALVLFSLHNDSQFLDAFRESQCYAANILTADQQALSNRFANPAEANFDDLTVETWETGAPIIQGCLAQFDCKIHQIADGGDHQILLGQVQRFAKTTDAKPAPLLYYGGSYRVLAD